MYADAKRLQPFGYAQDKLQARPLRSHALLPAGLGNALFFY
jgi:hypothetical protein